MLTSFCMLVNAGFLLKILLFAVWPDVGSLPTLVSRPPLGWMALAQHAMYPPLKSAIFRILSFSIILPILNRDLILFRKSLFRLLDANGDVPQG
jgi:hypothetical protein